MDQFGGGNWTMIPNMQAHGNYVVSSSQEHLLLQQQQQFQYQQQNQPHFQPPQDQQFQHQQQQFQHQQFQPQPQQQHQQRVLQRQHSNNQQQSLASYFHLYPLVEKLADAIENGTRDQNSDALVNELNGHFEKCQQLLNSISGSISSKSMTVEGQKQKLEESERLLRQRRDLISKYRNSVEGLTKPEP